MLILQLFRSLDTLSNGCFHIYTIFPFDGTKRFGDITPAILKYIFSRALSSPLILQSLLCPYYAKFTSWNFNYRGD